MKKIIQIQLLTIMLLCIAVAIPAHALPTASNGMVTWKTVNYSPPPFNRTYTLAQPVVTCTLSNADTVARSVTMNNQLFSRPDDTLLWNYDLTQTAAPNVSEDHTFEFDGHEINAAVNAYPGASFTIIYSASGVSNTVFSASDSHTY